MKRSPSWNERFDYGSGFYRVFRFGVRLVLSWLADEANRQWPAGCSDGATRVLVELMLRDARQECSVHRTIEALKAASPEHRRAALKLVRGGKE